MKNEYSNTADKSILHHQHSSEIYRGIMCYDDYMKKLVKEALEKVFKKNSYQDEIIKKFEPTVVLYILDSNCLYGKGHSSLLFLNKHNEGIYYNTAEIRDFTNAIKGKDIPYVIDRKVMSSEDVRHLLYNGNVPDKNETDKSHSFLRYDKYIAIPLETKREQKLALNKADQIYHQPGLYNLYERNCNHVIQEVLAQISKNFSPIQGSSELIINRFNHLIEKLKKMDFHSAKDIYNQTSNEMYETGIFPTGSYQSGVEFAEKRKYKFGSLPIKNLNVLTNKKTQELDPISENVRDVSNTIKKYNINNEIEKDIRRIYDITDPRYAILKKLHEYLRIGDIKKVFNLINENGKIKLDKTALKKTVDLCDLEYPNLNNMERQVLHFFIKSQQNKKKEIYSPSF